MTSAGANNKILAKMLERLFAGVVSGPGMNCRPHASRQRIDMMQLAQLQDVTPEQAIRDLLGSAAAVKITARVPPLPSGQSCGGPRGADEPTASAEITTRDTEPALSEQEQRAIDAWRAQQAVLGKLRIIAEEARTYELDTGVHALHLGFPLLSLPPGSAGAAASGSRVIARRLLAPVAFVPVTVTVRSAAKPQVVIECRGDEVDRVLPNAALLAWLERQTGKPAGELFPDEAGIDPWREIQSIVSYVATVLELPTMDWSAEAPRTLAAAPRAEDSTQPEILVAGVLGLFPQSNQGLLRDMQAMAAGESLDGPVQSFIDLSVTLDAPADASYEHEAWSGERRQRPIAGERHISASDPCQSRAVRLARECRGLVIHGPPGTGKSQTITNIIGDHLARGERVLMVCDKRTAMDVVANRLEHLGLGSLCALVHDPQRDQRDLYRNVREQLEALSDNSLPGSAKNDELARADAELERLHGELATTWKLLHEPDAARGGSFHELIGAWLATRPDSSNTALELHHARMADLTRHEHDVHDILERAARIDYGQNPWNACAAIELSEFLSRPMQQVREAVQRCLAAARAADESLHAAIPPFVDPAVSPLAEQRQSRLHIADSLETVTRQVPATVREHWSVPGDHALRRAARMIDELRTCADQLAEPVDAELVLSARGICGDLAAIQRQIAGLDAYLAIARRWYGLLCLRRRRHAAEILQPFGLPLDAPSAERVRRFLAARKARAMLANLRQELYGSARNAAEPITDEHLSDFYRHTALVLQLRLAVLNAPALAGLDERIQRALADDSACSTLLEGLRRSGRRAELIEALEQATESAKLIAPAWRDKLIRELATGGKAAVMVEPLDDQVDTIEEVLRIRHGVERLPAGLREAVHRVAAASLDSHRALDTLRHGVLDGELAEWLRGCPQLQGIDSQRMASSMERYRALDARRQHLVRDAVLGLWRTRQQERLLVGTRSRLNSLGADLRRRLTLRGERAMRLRQVIAVGQGIEGGDPLFDLRPVWMASPETVAQVLPRATLFDVVVFDEASQCRLEEALPVLTRARRVVIAGDPKQLPPTRFFESAIATSESEEVETEQQLFEVHQGEIEDLLGAALSIDIPQSYLDVHYRSRNADLIQFSNVQFYSSRLQPIPAHPNQRARTAPITLYRVDGVYDRRMNQAEAAEVVRIVADLLKRAEPPSIGVACFNIAQRDLIAELLDEHAEADPEFGQRLAESRARRGAASFEGLFVKNLENVQGDERDHVIISTTYGPDSKGRFYRRFGPVGRAGGGRRLNVLVTRARHQVHLVTSIPPAAYRGLPPVPAGQIPTGAWLLFAYLAYAESLAEAYEAASQDERLERTAGTPSVAVQGRAATSKFTESLARQLAARHGLGSDVHWGNDGFCVDLAVHHTRRADDRTLGVLCDGSRFAEAEDPVEWDVFRTGMLEHQGWKLHRVWSPQFFRDPGGVMSAVWKQVAAIESAVDGSGDIPNQETTPA